MIFIKETLQCVQQVEHNVGLNSVGRKLRTYWKYHKKFTTKPIIDNRYFRHGIIYFWYNQVSCEGKVLFYSEKKETTKIVSAIFTSLTQGSVQATLSGNSNKTSYQNLQDIFSRDLMEYHPTSPAHKEVTLYFNKVGKQTV